tara:strand:- start:252 stop:710 length:459 start_codon:yes stop_codon:yes gene_type:complete
MYGVLDDLLAEVLQMLDAYRIDKANWYSLRSEIEIVCSMPNTEEGLQCKRCLLFYAISEESVLQERFHKSDPELMQDLISRVFPLVVPMLLRNVGQRPDTFVAMISVIVNLWGDTPFALPPLWRLKDKQRVEREGQGCTPEPGHCTRGQMRY